jgi:UDPglucose 6-dehydrogenase
MRDAPAVTIIPALVERGARIHAHDPQGMDEARKVLPEEVAYFSDIYETIDQADAVILLTEWNVYRGLDIKQLRQRMRGNVFVDLRNVYEPAAMQQAGFDYVCVGRQPIAMEGNTRQQAS